MSEAGYVELPVLQWLSGHRSATVGDKGLGWTYRGEAEMAAFERPLEDPLVEKLLVDALLRINPQLTTPAQALLAIHALRITMAKPDRLAANRDTLDRLRDGISLVLAPGQDATTLQFIAFEADRQHLNDFTVTNQYRVQGVRQCRDDTVLLVNGIPLVVAEYKSYLSSGKDWKEAVHQLHRYQRQAPAMLVPNVFCVAADEETFRYGTVLFNDARQDDIERHLDSWGPWLSRYPDQKGYWNEPEADAPDDALAVPVKGLLRLAPCHLLDFLQHFVVFETKQGRTHKKVARYQQFEAVNDIVDRTLALVGQPVGTVSAQDRTGLVWHTQGSGKSLTMVFAAAKLRRLAAMHNPLVMIVVDRRDLKTQIADDFDACDYPNVDKALGVADLKQRLKSGWRGTLVTTLQAFQNMGDLVPLADDHIVSLVDECHRSQKGASADSYAMTMRVKLPNAFRYGLTGTPIDRAMNNTHRDFGPERHGEQERYLSYYGIKRAIKDGATLEVHFQRDKVPFIVDRKALNIGFEQMCAEMEVEDVEAKDLVQRQRSQWKELARHPHRVQIVAGKVVAHFLAHPDPSGFKAQLVGVDRTACARFKDALDANLLVRGLPPEWCDVIISEGQNDDADLARFHYGKARQDDLIEHFKLTPAQWEERNREAHGDDRAKWRPALKILIVCDRLLTGFDAPIEQVMYLDKPLRDHNLLQAIARTNRPLPAMGKRTGLVVDYFGVFSKLAKALNFDENIVEEALIDWDALKATVPAEVARCTESFAGITIADTRDCLLAALRALNDPDAAKRFEHHFKSLERLWEAVAPDPCLYPHRFVYGWLCSIYIAHRRRQRGAAHLGTYGELSAKTRELIEENTTFMDTALALPVFKIDKDYLAKLDDLPSAADKAAALEVLLTAELTEGDPGFLYQQLGDRLARLKAKKDGADRTAEARLASLQQLADAAVLRAEEPAALKLTGPGEYALFSVLREFSTNSGLLYLADCARRMAAHLVANKLLATGWALSKGGRDRVERSLLAESWNPYYAGLGFDPNAESPPFLQPAVAELVKADGGA